jgi:hypothetical protein
MAIGRSGAVSGEIIKVEACHLTGLSSSTSILLLQILYVHIVAPSSKVQILSSPLNLSSLEVYCFAAQMVFGREEVA